MEVKDIAEILLTVFDKVYWNVSIMDNGTKTNPRYWNGSEWKYVGLDKSKLNSCYIRNNGDDRLGKVDIGGCSNEYEITKRLRIVVYSSPICNISKSYYQTKLIDLLEHRNITIVSMTNDSNKLVKQESNSDIKLRGNEIYFAMDIELNQDLSSCCEVEVDPCVTEIDYCMCKQN
jgi:hypothetical protein